MATGLARDPEKRLLVDVGTNGEIALGNADRVIATSAPAGPAFEGGQILHGMRATEGAIEGVVLDAEGVHLQVIGGDVTPRGICGSALIDIVAQLRLTGLIKPNGSFVRPRNWRDTRSAPGSSIVRAIRAFALTDDVVLTPAGHPCARRGQGGDLDGDRGRDGPARVRRRRTWTR